MLIRKSIGLDLGSTSVKLVKLSKEGEIKVVVAATASLPSGVFYSDTRADQEAVATVIKKLFDDNQLKDNSAVIALPESQVFTRVIDVPQLSEQELGSALKWQAEQYIPLPLSEVNLDFSVVQHPSNPKEKMQVLLVAAPLRAIEWQTRTLELAGLTPRALETQITAAVRVFARFNQTGSASLIVDLGAATTEMAILRQKAMVFTHSINIGGQVFTRAIAENFNFSLSQAEEYKKAYGLEASHLQGKMRGVLQPVTDTIIEEMKKATVFYEKKYSAQVKTIILFGGAALMPGLVPYIAQSLGIEVQVGNPWGRFVLGSSIAPHSAEASTYVVATGLAMRDL